VVLLAYREIEERHFAGWSMGQVTLARLNPALLLKYSECARLDPYKLSGRRDRRAVRRVGGDGIYHGAVLKPLVT
jgi:hypothetical protein